MTKTLTLDGTQVGDGCKPYVIAEVSANHNGSLDKAKEIMTSAAENGADCVKLQTYTADTMTIKADRPEFRIKGGLWDGYELWDLYDWAHTPYEWHPELFNHAKELGISCFSTPFDDSAVELLESMNAPFYKIASFEMTDTPLIRRVAETGKPMIMSTGLATLEEIATSVEVARKHGSGELILLHCISGYPTPLEQANIRLMTQLREEFDVAVGLSDHTLDNTAAVVATALGACVIEKHFTLDRSEGGADAEFSMEPDQLRDLCNVTRGAWLSLGNGERLTASVQDGNRVFRRSVYCVADIAEGEIFTEKNIRCIRPGLGLPPERYEGLLGKQASQAISRGTPLSDNLVGG